MFFFSYSKLDSRNQLLYKHHGCGLYVFSRPRTSFFVIIDIPNYTVDVLNTLFLELNLTSIIVLSFIYNSLENKR